MSVISRLPIPSVLIAAHAVLRFIGLRRRLGGRRRRQHGCLGSFNGGLGNRLGSQGNSQCCDTLSAWAMML